MKKLALIVLAAVLFTSCGGGSSLKSNPENSFAHFYNLGMSSFHKKDYRGAIQHFKKSVSLNSKIAKTHNDLATCYMYLEQYEDAATHFEATISLDSSYSSAHNSLGVVYTKLKRYKDAEAQFKSVLYDNNYELKFLPLYNLGNIAFEQKKYDEALSYLEEALAEEYKITLDYKIYLHQMMGNIFFIKRNYKKAFSEFEKVLVLKPNMPETQYKYGISAYYTGNTSDARAILKRIVTREPENPWAIKAQKFINEMDR